jgi:hypothetical protein
MLRRICKDGIPRLCIQTIQSHRFFRGQAVRLRSPAHLRASSDLNDMMIFPPKEWPGRGSVA